MAFVAPVGESLIDVVPVAEKTGRSRQGEPVVPIQRSASRNSRASPPGRPLRGGICGSIRAHFASDRQWRGWVMSVFRSDVHFCIIQVSQQLLMACRLIVPQRCRCYLPKRVLTRLPMLPNSRIGELLPHHWISADYSLPSWEGQVQTELLGKEEGEEQQAQKR